MIKHHPTQDLLVNHANGNLPLSMAMAVSAHCCLCETCRQQLEQLTAQVADLVLAQPKIYGAYPGEETMTSEVVDVTTQDSALDMDAMMAHIMAQPVATNIPNNAPLAVQIKQQYYTVPSAFRQHLSRPWQILGKVSRMRFDVDEMNTRASLLHIDAQGEIPQHTHRGYELTLLLAGEFADLNGNYVPGDFIVLDGQHQHSPKTVNGCLCYTVLDAPLHFTKGISKLLNPIGELIY